MGVYIMSKEQKKSTADTAEKSSSSVKTASKDDNKHKTVLKTGAKSKTPSSKKPSKSDIASVSKDKNNKQATANLDVDKDNSKNILIQDMHEKEYATETRVHHEGLGDQWNVLVGNPARMMSQVVATVIHSGGTRAAWQRKDLNREYVMVAWPSDEPLRAAVVISGEVEGELKPITACPLLEGLPNDLEVDSVYVWENKAAANIALVVEEGRRPMWLYTPLYFRDREALTPGVTHTFLVAGLAYGLRHSLLDNITITKGPSFEAHAKKWLAEHEGKTHLDVPPIQVNVAGSSIILPGNNYCEYQMRGPILSVAHTKMDKLDVYMLHLRFEMKSRAPLDIMIYAPANVCAEGYIPKVDDEIDVYVWLQGRIIDYDDKEQ